MNEKIRKIIKTWDKESESYRFECDIQPDFLANIYHIRKCLGILKGKTILEVGSGSGQSSAYLASKGGEITLVDVSTKSLEFAKKYYASKKLKVTLLRQNAFAMKFPAESFDYVWNGGVIEHFDDKEKILMLRKMWNLVKPRGKLLITVPSASDIPFMVAKKVLEFRGKWSFGPEDDMTIRRMRKIAELAGIKRYTIYAFNPIVGLWFFPYGRETTDFFGLNTVKMHKLVTPFGHNIVFCAKK